ncbi:hypothetical protein [Salinarimonas ramus]|uniref:Uncharacterized protein n=1 Tax=Salinarimonas ramus TaxID=690164 RepID=A0A917Q5I0_9HYPH|nr:hypothetical protein [Salinarimonas ramus]GGK26023.1 hypothetical protein GCM10011322_10570 [Salinarimonas ramus]
MPSIEEHTRPAHAIHNPVADLSASPDQLLAELVDLRRRARPELDELCRELAIYSRHSEINEKSVESAKGKATRPSILMGKPWYTAAHLRDFLRFRTPLRTIHDAAKTIMFFAHQADQGALSLVKIDTRKFMMPNPYGWRMIAIDFRLAQSGMLVEHYMTYADCLAVNDLMLHAVYERWRNRGDELTIGERRRQAQQIGLSRLTNEAIFAEAARSEHANLDEARQAVAVSTSAFARSVVQGLEELISVS